MDYKWEQFGDEIKQSVQDAVERGDFSRLNQTVNDSVSRAADAISRGMKNGGWYRDPKANGGRNPDPKMNSGRNPDPGMAGSRNGADAHGTEADSRMSDHSIRHKVRCVI